MRFLKMSSVFACLFALAVFPAQALKRTQEVNLAKGNSADPGNTALLLTFFQAGGRGNTWTHSLGVKGPQKTILVDISNSGSSATPTALGEKNYFRIDPGSYSIRISCSDSAFVNGIAIESEGLHTVEVDAAGGKAYVFRCTGNLRNSAVAVQEVDQAAIEIK